MFYCLSNFNATFLRPLMLSSDNELTRQNEISYIEGSSFTQKSFSSSRKQDTLLNPDSHSRSTGVNSGQYSSMILERAHEAAIFGHSSVPLPSILGTDPAEGKDKLVSSVDTVKQLLHHSLDKSDPSTWDCWLLKLAEFKARRANKISSTIKTNQKKRINGIG
ncbi:unnamed protein product [Schistosoma mattheei]|uniref:Uncharacterized protein n=1 Tax=Schistosoma mattheei TaxID=31246 RepID=A0AA85B537_9TREM|nr:unnamed protein product [Schistosoma mattheei]